MRPWFCGEMVVGTAEDKGRLQVYIVVHRPAFFLAWINASSSCLDSEVVLVQASC